MTHYVLGRGEVAISMGVHRESNVPFIRLGKIEGDFKTGEDLLEKSVEKTNKSFIFIENLEGLAVLELAIAEAKKHLQELH